MAGNAAPQASTSEIGYLRTGRGGKVTVAVSIEAYNRLLQLAVAKDDTGTAEMVLGGSVYLADDGTPARVIGFPEAAVREIRIEGAPEIGRGGFVSADFVTTTDPAEQLKGFQDQQAQAKVQRQAVQAQQ